MRWSCRASPQTTSRSWWRRTGGQRRPSSGGSPPRAIPPLSPSSSSPGSTPALDLDPHWTWTLIGPGPSLDLDPRRLNYGARPMSVPPLIIDGESDMQGGLENGLGKKASESKRPVRGGGGKNREQAEAAEALRASIRSNHIECNLNGGMEPSNPSPLAQLARVAACEGSGVLPGEGETPRADEAALNTQEEVDEEDLGVAEDWEEEEEEAEWDDDPSNDLPSSSQPPSRPSSRPSSRSSPYEGGHLPEAEATATPAAKSAATNSKSRPAAAADPPPSTLFGITRNAEGWVGGK